MECGPGICVLEKLCRRVKRGGKSGGVFSGVQNRPIDHCLNWKWVLRIKCSLYSLHVFESFHHEKTLKKKEVPR